MLFHIFILVISPLIKAPLNPSGWQRWLNGGGGEGTSPSLVKIWSARESKHLLVLSFWYLNIDSNFFLHFWPSTLQAPYGFDIKMSEFGVKKSRGEFFLPKEGEYKISARFARSILTVSPLPLWKYHNWLPCLLVTITIID